MTQAEPISDLLAREREALRNADFAALRVIIEEKERMVEALKDAPVTDQAALAGLREMAERNAELMTAVQRGIESAAATLARMRDPDAPLDTYTQTGKRARIGTRSASLTRRA